MNAPNRPRLGDLPTMPIGDIAALSAAVLALLQEEAEEAAKAARHLADWLNGAIALRYGDRASAARRAEGKDVGTTPAEPPPLPQGAGSPLRQPSRPRPP